MSEWKLIAFFFSCLATKPICLVKLAREKKEVDSALGRERRKNTNTYVQHNLLIHVKKAKKKANYSNFF